MSDREPGEERELNIRFGVRIPPCTRIDEVAGCIERAEQLGFDVAWIPDSQLLWRDVFATMALGATRTQSIRIGTCVTNIRTRHPTVVASALNTLEELAPGRIVLGIGTGDSGVRTIGMRPARQAELREGIELIRRLQRGESCHLGGREGRLKDAAGVTPVYMAASGPRNLACAGEIAEGVITLAGSAPEALERTFGRVREGAEAAGRDLTEIDHCVGAFCHLTGDLERDARLLKPVCCTIAQIGGQDFLALAGIDLPNPGHIEGVYPDMTHAEDWDQAVEVADRYVTDEMAAKFARTFCLFGTPDDVVAGIEAAAAAGATSFYLRHVGNYSLPWDLMEGFARDVLPRVR